MSVTRSKLYKLVVHIGIIESIEINEYDGKFPSNNGNLGRILSLLSMIKFFITEAIVRGESYFRLPGLL